MTCDRPLFWALVLYICGTTALIPYLNLIKVSVIPPFFLPSSSISDPALVEEAGCSIKLPVPPSDTANEISRTLYDDIMKYNKQLLQH